MLKRSKSGACLVAAILPVIASGCAVAPPKPLPAGETATAFRARTMDDPALRDLAVRAGIATWPPASLDDRALTLIAVANGEAVQLAVAKWRVAEAAIRTAGQRPNPTLSVNPLYVTTAAAGVSPWMIAASLVQLLELGGKRPLRVEKAEYEAHAARYEAIAAAREASLRIDALLLDIAVANVRLSALDAQITAQSGLVEAAGKRLQVGLGSSVELATARSNLNRALLDRQTTQAAQADTLHRLAIAIGMPAERLALDRLVLPKLDQPLSLAFVDRARAVAPLNRADLLARLADYAAADTEVRLQMAGRVPNVEVGPSFEYDQGDRKWGLNLAAVLPVFNDNGGPIGEAVAQRAQAERQFTTAQATVIGEIDRARTTYTQAQGALTTAERLSGQLDKRARAEEKMFARGEIDRVELLTTRAELAVQMAARADAQGALAKAALSIETAAQLRADGFDAAVLLFPEDKK